MPDAQTPTLRRRQTARPVRRWASHSLTAAGWTLALLLTLGAAGELAAKNERPLAIVATAVTILCATLALSEWRRSRTTRSIGRSRAITRAALKPLARNGWKITHAVGCEEAEPPAVTIEHLVVADDDDDTMFAIQTAARSYTSADLERTLACAELAARQRCVCWTARTGCCASPAAGRAARSNRG